MRKLFLAFAVLFLLMGAGPCAHRKDSPTLGPSLPQLEPQLDRTSQQDEVKVK